MGVFLLSQDSSSASSFVKPSLPVAMALPWYMEHNGHENSDEVAESRFLNGENRLTIPIPKFSELFVQHAVAPFFLFQVFCVLLWCLDEYWYYSLMTLVMLFMFESTVVKQRLRNLRELRLMTTPPFPLWVWRSGSWSQIPSSDLVPGDIFSLSRFTKGMDGSRTVVPCDAVVLDCESCVVNEAVLTGESVAQMKDGIKSIMRHMDEGELANTHLDLNGRHKACVVFAGTHVLQAVASKGNKRHRTPDGGCPCVAVRTGFETAQGSLVRTIGFSRERVSVNNRESYFFILFLLTFALAAAGYLLKKSLEESDHKRPLHKILLDCTLIVTAVVPPELPMELSLAVNASLMHLVKSQVFCTEPFRIPLAGKVDFCCFDKTGTLTSETMSLRGIVPLRDDADEKDKQEVHSDRDFSSYAVEEMDQVPAVYSRAFELSLLVLQGCHSLVLVDGTYVGDAMEKAAMDAIPSKRRVSNTIIHRFHFDPELKRMSSVVRTRDRQLVLTKGAPEVVRGLLTEIPHDYDDKASALLGNGARVLALALKDVSDFLPSKLRVVSRDAVECGLTFVGFAVFECPIKSDTVSVIQALGHSSHSCVMITGDNPKTAIHAAHECSIVSRPVLMVEIDPKEGIAQPKITEDKSGTSAGSVHECRKLVWKTISDEVVCPVSERPLENDKELIGDSRSFELCLSGDVLSRAFGKDEKALRNFISDWVLHVKVFARMSPKQKEYVVQGLRKTHGKTTLMCGDGTNDMGALKHADVGIALLNHAVTPPADLAEKEEDKHRDDLKRGNLHPPDASKRRKGWINGLMPKDKKSSGAKELRKSLEEKLRSSEGGGEPPMIRLGDASIAAPFTAKSASIQCAVDVIRQGRCTLVTTIQIYKILALNCLISAYTLSVLYMQGLKFGDRQMFFSSILIAACFFFISSARPLPKLSSQRPWNTIFCAYAMMSILGQFLIHLGCLVYAVRWTDTLRIGSGGNEAESSVDLDSDFEPSLINTVVFPLSSIMQLTTFAFNYQGHPFMESLTENKKLLFSLCIAGSLFILCASGLLPPLNCALELVPLPSWNAILMVLSFIAADIGAVYVWEFLFLRNIFSKH
eukprot:TRINITY_DN2378_c0_g2_i2.p1 TRINITY_DN2378_c0_g2~~TRINITY_DN2378_c0_g2_i2.p1  ORF type:complete len:1092 (-),score=243.90 TRINITY_DN2378_c0_g2_i2:127-3402(-)